MIASCFTAWQTGSGEKNQSFNSYLQKMGFSDKPAVMNKKEKINFAKKAIQKVKEMFNKVAK